MEQKDSMAGPSAWFCFILSFDFIKNSCIFRQFVLTCMPAASAETGRIHSSWQIFENFHLCHWFATAQVEKIYNIDKSSQ